MQYVNNKTFSKWEKESCLGGIIRTRADIYKYLTPTEVANSGDTQERQDWNDFDLTD